MALEGTLKDFSLADIFQLIGLQRKTGVLTLKGKDDVVTVSFLDGKLVSSDSLQRRVENRLGNVLVKTGRVSEADLERALSIQKQTLQRLGTILVENAIVERDVLREALQIQILQTIYRLFRWKDGDYHFSQETSIEYDRDYVTPIAAESILMEGARMIDEWPIIERKIRSGDMVFRKVPIRQQVEIADLEDDADEVDFDFGDSPASKPLDRGPAGNVKISRQEGFVYDLVDGRTTVSDIVERSRYHEFDTVKALYELLSRGLIEEARADKGDAITGGVAALEDDEEKRSLAGPLAVIGLAALLILSVVGMLYNPVNSFFHRDPGRRLQNIVRRSVSVGRLERVASAAETYLLISGGYPQNLAQLVDSHLIEERGLLDPWGAKYRYQNQNDKYFVDGRPPGASTDFRLFLTKSIHQSRDMPSETTPSGPSLILLQ